MESFVIKDDHEEQSLSGPFKIAVFYGSNNGLCEGLATGFLESGNAIGLPISLDELDIAKKNMPAGAFIVIITSTYDGKPPYNASKFLDWLESLKGGDELHGVRYAVFGTGDSDWGSEYLQVPKQIDQLLALNGGTRVADMGIGDVTEGDVPHDFRVWQDDVLISAIKAIMNHH